MSSAKFCSSCGADVNFINKVVNSASKKTETIVRPNQNIVYKTSANTDPRRMSPYLMLEISNIAEESKSDNKLILIIAAIIVVVLAVLGSLFL